MAGLTLTPGSLTFLAGLSAGAGINMLTSVATDPDAGTTRIVLDSVLWVIAAALLTAMATVKSRAQSDADRATNPDLSAAENDGARDEIFAATRPRLRLLGTAAAVALLAAALFVPHLIDWRPDPPPSPDRPRVVDAVAPGPARRTAHE